MCVMSGLQLDMTVVVELDEGVVANLPEIAVRIGKIAPVAAPGHFVRGTDQARTRGDAAQLVRQLEREAQSNRSIYEDFLKRSKEVREQQDIQQPDARVLSPANLPTAPAFPRYGLTMIAAVVGPTAAFRAAMLSNGRWT